MRVASTAVALVLTSFCVAGAAPLPPPDPIGEWMVQKGYAKIRIVNCDSQLWGVVAWEKKAGIDKNNPDPSKRARPTLGMPVLIAMKPTEPNRWEGEIYNSEDGKTYSSHISLASPDVLQVRGCVLGFLCGGEDWSRVRPDDQQPGVTPGAKPARGTSAPVRTTTTTTAPKPADPRTRNPKPGNAQPPTPIDVATASQEDVCLGLGLPGASGPLPRGAH